MVINPVSMMMRPVFAGSEMVGATPVPVAGPKVEPSFQTTVSKAPPADETFLYSLNSQANVQHVAKNDIDQGINQSKRSSFKGCNADESHVAKKLVAQHYGLIRV